ncbi:DUF4175 family protein [Pontibacter sp. G13]|uniref:DUF4175 family protein n=1 Tax=Pontibacter sp. G13 TaxID=3074898 RepID=UPI002889A7FF|nr:DUF4175 family protein [Pontibacter sp. G13]WNJ15916.1 DUF4175 family protein [Pontibacter sp. G13]
MNRNQEALDHRLQEFRKKYYVDKIIRGSLILALLMSSILFVALLSEGLFGFSSAVRTGMVVFLGLGFLGVLGYMVIWPFSQMLKYSKGITDFQIADMVNRFFPEISDKLTNVLQLRKNTAGENTLAMAAIDQKAKEITPVQLSSAINLKLNRKYAWYLLVPLVLYFVVYLFDPAILGTGIHRLTHYNQQFVPPPPFEITISGVPESMVAGETLDLEIEVAGKELPSELFIYIKGNPEEQSDFIDYSLNKNSATEFSYSFPDVKGDFEFYVGNVETETPLYKVDVLKRPFIKNFQVRINYPKYTGLPSELLDPNVGDFKAIKGSYLTWNMIPNGDVQAAALVVDSVETEFEKSEDGSLFTVGKRLMRELDYHISLTSSDAIQNLDTVKYRVQVIADRHPSMYVFSPNNDYVVDLDPVMVLDLEISDDFGFSKMNLHYRFTKSGGTSNVSAEYQSYPLSIESRTLLQPLNYAVDLTQLGLQEGDELEYYLEVWDNDAVSGPKSATSATYKVVHPTLDAKYEEVGEQQDEVNEEIEELKETSQSLREAYQKMQEKLLDQKRLSFDDKKELERMMKEHQNMLQQLSETQEKFEEAKRQLEENQMISEQTLEKYEDLNKFLEELNDPEIEKLLEEIQEKMEDLNTEDLMEQLEQLELNDQDIQKSLERTLELLKQLEVDQKIDEIRNKVDNLKSKQDFLNEQLEQAETPEELEQLSDRQEALSEQMEDIQESLDDLQEMKDETESSDDSSMEEVQEQGEEAQENMEQAAEQMQEASEQMQEGGRKNQKQSQQNQQESSESQKGASQKLQEMSEALESMQMQMSGQQDQENLENLRELLENLLKLSFDQEDLRDEVESLKYGDPSLKEKSQRQKDLQDDMGLVRDSLESLANRVFQIQKYVLDESQKITGNMQKSQTFFRNKQVPMITYHQQSAMTSINNLANMLSDVMKQIQEQMMNSQAGNGMCQKPGGKKPNMQGVGEQQKKLNQQMMQMMRDGQMSGQQLQKMAGQQEAIRKQLEEAQRQLKEQGGNQLGDLDKIQQQMIESESDLLNKNLTHETLKRQQEILSRLLQADRSVREREFDNKRESKTGRTQNMVSPDDLSLEEYKHKIRQELLKSNKLEYSSDFIILIEQYFKMLEGANEQSN